MANGAKAKQATHHRQKASPIGGMCPLILLAITILTDQSKVAKRANTTPFVLLFIILADEFWRIAIT